MNNVKVYIETPLFRQGNIYHETNPENKVERDSSMTISDIFRADNFFSLSMEEARPTLERFLYTYLGIFPLAKAERPQTDGKRIFLTARKNDFTDDKKELHNNRNMTLYLSDLLHELLHIREGSFLVDARPYLETYQNGGLAHALYNGTDDARIEHNGKKYIKWQDYEMLEVSNIYYAKKRAFPNNLSEQVLEMYESMMIGKSLPADFQPALKEAQEAALTAAIENEELQQQGIRTAADVLKKMVEIGSKAYGEPVEAVWLAVPQLYGLITKAFPTIEQTFPTKNSAFAPILAPQAGKGKGSRKGSGRG